MTDKKSISFSQDHELNYVLGKFDKRATEENRAILKEIGTAYKKEKNVRIVDDREDFYTYFQAHVLFKKLENKK